MVALGQSMKVRHLRVPVIRATRHRWNPTFRQEFEMFRSLPNHERLPIRCEDRYPCLNEPTPSRTFDWHCVCHTDWVAGVLARIHPEIHTDVSSPLYFGTLVSAIVPTTFCDSRPADVRLGGLETHVPDVTALPFADGSVWSLSCMHAVEHIGLGRYRDPIDQDGELAAISKLRRVLQPGGDLLSVVPVGSPRVMSNAHRI